MAGRLESDTLILEVADNGIGMPEEVRERLFGKFYSTKGSTGTGLGLVVTKKIVQEHRGRIKVNSRPGEGTTFLVEIPLAAADRSHALQSAN